MNIMHELSWTMLARNVFSSYLPCFWPVAIFEQHCVGVDILSTFARLLSFVPSAYPVSAPKS